MEYIENTIKSIKGQASQVNKNPDNFQIIVAAYPNVIEGQSSKNAEKRFPFSGRLDEIRTAIERIKQMGIDHIIFGSIGKDLNKVTAAVSVTRVSQLNFDILLLEHQDSPILENAQNAVEIAANDMISKLKQAKE